MVTHRVFVPLSLLFSFFVSFDEGLLFSLFRSSAVAVGGVTVVVVARGAVVTTRRLLWGGVVHRPRWNYALGGQ